MYRLHTGHCQNRPLSITSSPCMDIAHVGGIAQSVCPVLPPSPYQVNDVCRDEMRRFAVARSSALGLPKAIAFACYACTFLFFFDTTLPSAPGKRGPKTPASLPPLFPEGRSAPWLGHAHVACPRRCKVSSTPRPPSRIPGVLGWSAVGTEMMHGAFPPSPHFPLSLAPFEGRRLLGSHTHTGTAYPALTRC